MTLTHSLQITESINQAFWLYHLRLTLLIPPSLDAPLICAAPLCLVTQCAGTIDHALLLTGVAGYAGQGGQEGQSKDGYSCQEMFHCSCIIVHCHRSTWLYLLMKHLCEP